MFANLNGVSQSVKSWPFQLKTSSTCRMPLSRQFKSSIQSRIVKGGREEGKGAMSDFPRVRDRSVVLGTIVQVAHIYRQKLSHRLGIIQGPYRFPQSLKTDA
jgi:hypothetical protein